MLLRQSAVKEFLARPRKDFRKWKTVPEAQLEEFRRELPVRPPIWSKLMMHQKICFLIGARARKFAWFNDMGTGKSCVAIALIRYFETLGEVKRALILVPNRVNKAEWVRELEKHSPDSKYLVLDGSSKEKWAALRDSDATFVVETYAGMVRMVCALQPHPTKSKKTLRPDIDLTQEFIGQFQALISDEGTVLGNHQSLPFRICRKFVQQAPVYFTLTGTPFGRDPTLLWGQMYLVDGGASLGPTLGLYRAAFFHAKPNFWGGVDYKFDKTKEADLNRLLANRSIRYVADEADLPKVVRIQKYVSLTHDAESYAHRARAALIAAKGKYTEQKNAFLRMRQISSGYIGYKDEDDGSRAEFAFDENPKLDMLMSIVESTDYKLVILNEFHYSGSRICEELRKREIGHVRVYGETKNPSKELAAFNQNASVQILVLSNAMALGLNLQVAKAAIFYESPVSVIMRKQAERRVERQGSQHNKVFIYDLVTRKTYDDRILFYHRIGGDLFRAIIEGVEEP